MDVKGKVAFVTGGASGIGLGMSLAFVNAGMRVVMADIRQDHIDEALARFEQAGQSEHVHGIRLDVTDREAYETAAATAEKVFGKVHVLCNNAGMGLVGAIRNAKFADWDWGLSVMLGGVVNGIQIFLPRILRHGEGGQIVSTSSMCGVLPISNTAIYSTVKAALVGMSEALRGELEADNIGVSAFCPGPVQTNIRETGKTRPEKYRDSGYLEHEKQLAERPNSPNWMSIEECGERVLRGIQRNDLYIFTHPEFKAGVAERFECMMRYFPDEPPNAALVKEVGFLLHNPIFTRDRNPA